MSRSVIYQVIDGLLISLCLLCSLSLWAILYATWPFLSTLVKVAGTAGAAVYTLSCILAFAGGRVRYREQGVAL